MLNRYVMDIRDLLVQLRKLEEASVKPGERKDISFKLEKLDKLKTKLDAFRNHAAMLSNPLSPELKDEYAALYNKISTQGKVLNDAYQLMYQKYENNSYTPVKLESLLKGLKKNCKDVLQVYKKLIDTGQDMTFMYRGITKTSADALYGKPFEARKPKDSNAILHKILLDKMTEMGIKANRQNTTFMTGRYSQADGYGTVYIMFPVDGFDFSWSTKIGDLILDNDKFSSIVQSSSLSDFQDFLLDEKKKDEESGENKMPSMSVLLGLFRETYRFSYDYDYMKQNENMFSKEIMDRLENIVTPSDIQGYFDFKDDNLFAAIESGKEICVTGPYYAVHHKYKDQLTRLISEMSLDTDDLPEKFGELFVPIANKSTVEIIKGPHAGKIGVIDHPSQSNKQYEISLTKVKTVTVNQYDVKLLYKPDENLPIIGQQYYVSDNTSIWYGYVGKVTYIYGKVTVELNDKVDLLKTQLQPAPKNYPPLDSPENPYIKEGDLVEITDQSNEYYGKIAKVKTILTYNNMYYLEVVKSGEGTSVNRTQIKKTTEKDVQKINEPKPASTDNQLKVGDSVKIKGPSAFNNSSFIGYDGTITSVTADGKFAGVRIEVSSGEETILTYDVSNLSKPEKDNIDNLTWEPEPEVSTPLKVGDKVKISYGQLAGQIGVVAKINSGAVYPYDVKIDSNPNEVLVYKATELEKATPEKEPLKPGDMVTITGPSHYAKNMSMIGKQGKIVFVGKGTNTTWGNTTTWYDVEFPSGSMYTYSQDSVEKVTDQDISQPEATTHDFKPGDWVKSLVLYPDQIGKIINIEVHDVSNKPYATVKMTNGNTPGIYLDELVKVEDPAVSTTPKTIDGFSIGETIKIVNPPAAYPNLAGETGKITDITFQQKAMKYYATVKTKEGEYALYTDTLEKVSDNSNSTDFKVGDKVKVTYQESPHYGKTGKIVYVPDEPPSGNNWVDIDLEDGNKYAAYVSSIEKIA